MEQVQLRAEPRSVTGKQVRRLRREGWVPAVLYGRGIESRPLQIRARELETILPRATTSHLISLQVTGDERPVQALIRDVQRDPIRRNVLHVDLYQVEMSKPITVDIPLVFVGESPVVERGLGILLQLRETLEIECLPKDLVDAIEVDLASLTEVGQEVTVADLAIPAGIRVLADEDEVIVSVAPLERAEEEEVEEVEEIAPPEEEPELVRRRREEAEEEE